MVGSLRRLIASGLALVWAWPIIVFSGAANAQAPVVPSPPIANPSPVPPRATAREGQLETRVQELETIIQAKTRRESQLEDRLRRLEELSTRPSAPSGAASTTAPTAPTTAAGGAVAPAGSQIIGGEAAPRGPFVRPPSGRFDMPAQPKAVNMDAIFGPGFQIQSKDGEFQLQFHDLTQIEGRFLGKGGQEPVNSTFLINRQWFMFAGRLTKPYEYFISWAQGIDTITPLDVWLNVNYDQRLQFKMGRMFTPFAYEWFNVPTNALIAPERSLFYNNFGPGRDTGAMAWGTLFDTRIGYAVGIFNGFRNGVIDTNDFKDVDATVNFRPFVLWDDSWLQHLNVGGSVSAGIADNGLTATTGQVLRTSANLSGGTQSDLGPEFFVFNNNVREFGFRALWDLHVAYYYRHLSLIAEWQSGFETYGTAVGKTVASSTSQTHNPPTSLVHVPIQSYYVMAGYFLTGETASSRGVLKPIRDFDLRKGKFGLGALELYGRFNPFNMGNQVFTGGLADPNLWTNNLYTIDLGVNWYWTQYIKVTLGWQHAEFGSPVSFAPLKFQKTSDEAILRMQFYF
jgi:phosphate-selective porin OprO and OprP